MKQRFQPGSFVWTFDQYGIGQISSIERDQCNVKFFKSINDEVEGVYSTTKLESAYLSPQTRAYHRDEDGIWSVGRIIDFVWDKGRMSYDVRFPNGRELRIGEDDIRVRCLQPVDDPAAILAAGGMESQFLHDRRRAAIECLTTGRSASFGLTALLSASVELAPHQVDVVRRILSDPVQRYLLADEVGLGKTIEACAIISQALRDNPEECAVVVVPSTLIGQWKRELSWRFFLEPSLDRLTVISYEEVNSIDPLEVDFLIVDEAQNLIPDNPEASESFSALKDIAHRAHRLLLISATPVLGNEKTLLALLHFARSVYLQTRRCGRFCTKAGKAAGIWPAAAYNQAGPEPRIPQAVSSSIAEIDSRGRICGKPRYANRTIPGRSRSRLNLLRRNGVTPAHIRHLQTASEVDSNPAQGLVQPTIAFQGVSVTIVSRR